MIWDWTSFLAGAPIWGSLGIALFTALVRAAAPERRRTQGAEWTPRQRVSGDQDVISLGAYRRRRRGASRRKRV